MTVIDVVNKMKRCNEFSIYNRTHRANGSKQPGFSGASPDILVFFGSKEDFLSKEFTSIEKRAGDTFSSIMKKNRETIRSFNVEAIDFDNAGIYVNDLNKELVNIS